MVSPLILVHWSAALVLYIASFALFAFTQTSLVLVIKRKGAASLNRADTLDTEPFRFPYSGLHQRHASGRVCVSMERLPDPNGFVPRHLGHLPIDRRLSAALSVHAITITHPIHPKHVALLILICCSRPV